MLAACTATLSKRPSVSTRMWRLRPLIFLPASKPCGSSTHDPTRQARRPQATAADRSGLRYPSDVLSTGCQWQALLKDLPPKSIDVREILNGIFYPEHRLADLIDAEWGIIEPHRALPFANSRIKRSTESQPIHQTQQLRGS